MVQPQKNSFGWSCAACTYKHMVPAARCAMCGALRNATHEQMRDFVLGKTLPKSDDGNVVEIMSESQSQTLEQEQDENGFENKQVEEANQSHAQNGNSNTNPQHKMIGQNNPYLKQPPGKSTNRKSASNTSTANFFARPDSTSTNHSVTNSWNPTTKGALHPTAPPRQSPSANRPTAPANLPTPAPSTNGNHANPKKASLKSPFPIPKSRAYAPGPIPLCPNAKDSWIYPKHPDYPTRQYQLEISESAVQYNTLVSLPTGLGKTLIAAVVMYNYWRWFPTGKVIFLAPTLPLVNQQVEACFKIMGIPESCTAVLTGKLSKEKRFACWRDKRVFYCTPQTVQKDLDTCVNAEDEGLDSSFANQVVCLVLDEAHKASGEYAYVKVIEQLEKAGSVFRIVGLSATPGTTIKAIQKVAEALRTSRIEARHESDPTVQPYLHQKHMEIVIVPRNSAQREVERRLSNLVAPVIDQLRKEAGFRHNPNNPIKAIHIVNAKALYAKRHNGEVPGHLRSMFATVQKLSELQNDSQQSLGIVRTKMIRLRNETQRGILSTIVKGKEFQEVFQMVLGATNPKQGKATLSQQQANMRNNPKLSKLTELLEEHFCRAQACGKNSRVIVFSQFRDSVSEIVLVLRSKEPLICPHHFVGQGKPTKKTGKAKSTVETDSGGIMRLRGMKQAEQQEVIQQFRNGVYNVLVCTCIGEEGLDIGEVDLIVNYDTLRSPIRMIQRTGRTGRARDGRVVCLLAEGQEQKTYNDSKQAEQTLMRALAKKSNFTMTPHIPMLPKPPQREERVMEIQSELRLSQVVGSNGTSSYAHKVGTSKPIRYKLDGRQEEERFQRLGKLVKLDETSMPWEKLKKFFVRNRSSRQGHHGRTAQILKGIESFGATTHPQNMIRRAQVDRNVLEIFPLEELDDEDSCVQEGNSTSPNGFFRQERQTEISFPASEKDMSKDVSGGQTKESSRPLQESNIAHPVRSDSIQTATTSAGAHLENIEHRGIDPSNTHADAVFQRGQVDSLDTINSVTSTNGVQPLQNSDPIPQLPVMAATKPHQEAKDRNGDTTTLDQPYVAGLPETSRDMFQAADQPLKNSAEQRVEEPVFRLPTPPPSSGDEDEDEDEDEKSLTAENTLDHLEQVQGFRLPTPPPSSEDEDEDDNEKDKDGGSSDEATHGLNEQPYLQTFGQVVVSTHSTDRFPASRTNSQFCSNMGDTNGTEEVLFRLPTQSSSSEGEDSCDEEDESKSPDGTCDAHLPRKPFEANNSLDDESADIPLAALKTPKAGGKHKKRKALPPDSIEFKRSKARSATKGQNHDVPPDSFKKPKATIGKPDAELFCSSMTSTPQPIVRHDRSKRKCIDDSDISQTLSNIENTPNEAHINTDCTPVDSSLRQTTTHHSSRNATTTNLTDTPLTNRDLTDTPNMDLSTGKRAFDNMSCCVCFSRDSLDEDPIILCDGCDLAFHESCYSIDVDINSEAPWFCDMCNSGANGDQTKSTACSLCTIGKKPLKKFESSGWYHPFCQPFVKFSCLTSRKCINCAGEGAVRCFCCSSAMHPYCALHEETSGVWTIVMVQGANTALAAQCAIFCPRHTENVNVFITRNSEGEKMGTTMIKVIQSRSKPEVARPKRLKKVRLSPLLERPSEETPVQKDSPEASIKARRKERRREVMSKFVLDEAEIDSENDPEGDCCEDDEIEQLELDEMSHDSFINDSSELTQHFSQDNLAGIDPDAASTDDFAHRALDAQRVREDIFKTPLLNRRMRNEDSQNTTSSQKGLGNMHFIRSVLEHHRQGGDSEEIEKLYHQVQQEGTPSQS